MNKEEKQFMIADGTYCHILPDKIIFGEPISIIQIPEMNHSNRNTFTLLMALFYTAIISGLSYLYFNGNFVQWLWLALSLAAIGGLYSLFLNRDASDTNCIERNLLTSVKLIKRNWGYSTIVFFFKTNKGEKLRKIVNIYDSAEFEAKAELLLKQEQLI
jgi:hypothetical protein